MQRQITPNAVESKDSGDASSGFVSRLTTSLKNITLKATEIASKAAFDLVGTASDAYGQNVDALFAEAYFIEAWIKELITLPRERTSNEEVLLSKLSMVSNFFHECILDVVLSDL